MTALLLAALLLPGAPPKTMYMSVGEDGVAVVTDYPRDEASRYKPGDFEKIALRQMGVPHRGVSFAEEDFGGPAVEITVKQRRPTAPAAVEALLVAASARFGVDLSLLRAVVAVESAFNPNAVSHAGAQGLMQLMPTTAADLGVRNPFDPEENITGGAKYLSFLLKHFHDEELAVAAYNAGPTRVTRAGGVPNIPETQAYVTSVLGLRQAYDSAR